LIELCKMAGTTNVSESICVTNTIKIASARHPTIPQLDYTTSPYLLKCRRHFCGWTKASLDGFCRVTYTIMQGVIVNKLNAMCKYTMVGLINGSSFDH